MATLRASDEEEMACVIPFTVTTNGTFQPCFVVATGIFSPDDVECTEGRLLVATYTEKSPRLEVVTSVPINGYGFALVEVNGLIAVAVNTSVSFSLARTNAPPAMLLT